jgi:hypothetical protein
MAVLSPCSGYNFESTEILPHSALDKKALMPEANWPKIMLFRRSFDAMELSTTRTFQAGDSPKEAIPYSSEALRQDVQRVRDAWVDCQATRDRNAIYGYLTPVYALVSWWTAEGQEIDRARRALRLQQLKVSDREDPFAAVIRCTADPAKADKRTRSKWSRVLRYATAYMPDSEPLDEFIRRKCGINECAARFTRALGRGALRRTAD